MISADDKLEQIEDLSFKTEADIIKNNLPQFVKAVGVFYKGVLQDVKKHVNPLQPIFEAFTNSLEAIYLRTDKKDNGSINIKIYSFEVTKESPVFEELTIEDTGIGFTDKEFERFTTYKDNQKGFNNRGSGRIQLIHHFDEAKYIIDA